MAIDIDEDVLRFDISVDDVLSVQVFKPEQQLCEVEPSLILCKLLHLTQMEEHLASSTQVHHEEELCLRLEGPIQLYDKWMVDLLHYPPLIDDWFHFLLSG